MKYEDSINHLPLIIEYDYQEYDGKKFPKIQTIFLKLGNDGTKSWDLMGIVDLSVIEQIKSRIFKELNKEIYNT